MNHLQTDIDLLENEKVNLRDKLKELTNKSEGSKKSTSNITGTSLNTLSSSISLTTSNLSAIESSYIMQMRILKRALKQTNDKLYDLKCKQSLNRLKDLKVSKHKPIWLLRLEKKLNSNESRMDDHENSNPDQSKLKDDYNIELFNLFKRIRNLEKETTICQIEEARIVKNKPFSIQAKEEELQKKIIAEKYRNLQEDIKSFRLKYFDFIGNDMNNTLNDLINQVILSKSI